MTLECGDEGVKTAQRYRMRGSSRVFEIIANPLLRLIETEPRESSSTAAPRGHFIDDIRVSLPPPPPPTVLRSSAPARFGEANGERARLGNVRLEFSRAPRARFESHAALINPRDPRARISLTRFPLLARRVRKRAELQSSRARFVRLVSCV